MEQKSQSQKVMYGMLLTKLLRWGEDQQLPAVGDGGRGTAWVCYNQQHQDKHCDGGILLVFDCGGSYMGKHVQ